MISPSKGENFYEKKTESFLHNYYYIFFFRCVDPEDYFGVRNLTVTFEPGQTNASFQVLTVPDSLDEGEETFVAEIASVGGALIGTNSAATATIEDCKWMLVFYKAIAYLILWYISIAITVQFDPTTYSTTEGVPANLTIVLSSAVEENDVTVRYSTSDGLASGKYVKLHTVICFVINIPVK